MNQIDKTHSLRWNEDLVYATNSGSIGDNNVTRDEVLSITK